MKALKRIEFGEYIVADPEICGGELTFKGTRIFVKDVLEIDRPDQATAGGMNLLDENIVVTQREQLFARGIPFRKEGFLFSSSLRCLRVLRRLGGEAGLNPVAFK